MIQSVEPGVSGQQLLGPSGWNSVVCTLPFVARAAMTGHLWATLARVLN